MAASAQRPVEPQLPRFPNPPIIRLPNNAGPPPPSGLAGAGIGPRPGGAHVQLVNMPTGPRQSPPPPVPGK